MPDIPSIRLRFDETPTAEAVERLAEATLAAQIELVFDVEDLPAETIAAFVDAVDRWLAADRSVRLLHAPQLLAHTLYKGGRLQRSSRLTISVRETEPYAG